MSVRLPLASIVADATVQMRAQISDATVTEYAQRMAVAQVSSDSVQFPPVVVFNDGSHYYLADGFHRLYAVRRNGWRDIEAAVFTGTKLDAIWYAIGSNKHKGSLPRTDADDFHAAKMALLHWSHLSNQAIAAHIGCREYLVSYVRSQMNADTNGGGETPHAMTSEQTPREKPHRIVTLVDFPDAPSQHPRVSARYKPQYGRGVEFRDQIIAMMQQGVQAKDIRKKLPGVRGEYIAMLRRELKGETADVRAQLQAEGVAKAKKMREMADSGYNSHQIAATFGMTFESCRRMLQRHDIAVPADKVLKGTRKIDSNRVVEQTVMDAADLTSDLGLVNFDQLDDSKRGGWVKSLKKSRRLLGEFITRLSAKGSESE
jgi:uncharacterized ParB-like nuclease family protein